MDFAFGLIADIQYVDAPDGTTHDGSMVRRHRQSLETLKTACLAYCEVTSPRIEHCVLLGDVLDGKSKNLGLVDPGLVDVLCALSMGPQNATWHTALGNHDLVCLTRAQILETFIPQCVRATCSVERLYYDVSPLPGVRFIFLDGYDKSVLGPSKEEHKAEVEALLARKNPNLSVPGASWFEGLGPMDRRYVPYNGAVGAEQLAWLENTLFYCSAARERAFLFTHMPIYAAACRVSGLVLNAEEVMAAVHRFPGVVGAVFAGLDHDGGYNVDAMGVHHIIPPAPLECNVGQVAYGHVTVHLGNTTTTAAGRRVDDDHFVLHWQGKTPSSPLYAPWPAGKRLSFPPFED